MRVFGMFCQGLQVRWSEKLICGVHSVDGSLGARVSALAMGILFVYFARSSLKYCSMGFVATVLGGALTLATAIVAFTFLNIALTPCRYAEHSKS